MIYERFILVVTCAALSSSAASSTWATELKTAKSRLDNIQIDRVNKTSTKNSKIDYLQSIDRVKPQEVVQLAQQSQNLVEEEVSDSSTSPEQVLGISRRWSLIAMIATILTSVYLLWLLFKKPSPKPKPVTMSVDLGNEQDTIESVAPLTVISGVEDVTATKENSGLLNFANDSVRKLGLTENELNLTIEELASEIYLLELIENLQQDNLYLRRKAVNKLAQVGNSRAIEPLVKIMSEANSMDKSLILKAISQITSRDLRPINHELFTSLQHEDPEIRKSSIRDLTILYKFMSPMTKQLAQMQLDADLEVRKTAQQAIRQLNLSFSVATSRLENGKKKSIVDNQSTLGRN